MLLLATACAFHIPAADQAGWAVATPEPAPGRFDRRLVAAEPRCDGAPVTVAVHGWFGAGPEWEASLASLPGDVWFYRWSPFQAGEDIFAGLAEGLAALDDCGRPVYVLAHSAGGVVASKSSGRFAAPEAPITVLTVASPIGGIGLKDPVAEPEGPFARHFGERIEDYAAPPEGVRVLHLRTSPASDPFSRVRKGHDPVAVRVPGATVVDLPVELGHDASLVWVAERLGDGRWAAWLDQPVARR